MVITDDATRLAPWIRRLPLDAQILITGATLMLADIEARLDDAPAPINEKPLRENSDPRRAARLARELADTFRPHAAGHVDLARVVSLAIAIADKIDEHVPPQR